MCIELGSFSFLQFDVIMVIFSAQVLEFFAVDPTRGLTDFKVKQLILLCNCSHVNRSMWFHLKRVFFLIETICDSLTDEWSDVSLFRLQSMVDYMGKMVSVSHSWPVVITACLKKEKKSGHQKI